MRIVADIVIVLAVSLAWDVLCRSAGLSGDAPLELVVRTVPAFCVGVAMGRYGFAASAWRR